MLNRSNVNLGLVQGHKSAFWAENHGFWRQFQLAMRNVNDVKLHLTLQFLGNGDKHSLLVLIDQRFDPTYEHVHLEHRCFHNFWFIAKSVI